MNSSTILCESNCALERIVVTSPTELNKISPHIPKDIAEYREPFLGGGSVALYVTQNYDVPVWVNDLYEPLYNFWQYLQSDGERLSTELADLKTRYHNPDRARVLFGECKECLANTKKSHAAETGLETFDQYVPRRLETSLKTSLKTS